MSVRINFSVPPAPDLARDATERAVWDLCDRLETNTLSHDERRALSRLLVGLEGLRRNSSLDTRAHWGWVREALDEALSVTPDEHIPTLTQEPFTESSRS